MSVLSCSFSWSRHGSSQAWNACESTIDGRAAMYLIGGVLALGLLVYLMVALLKPEWF
jgi:K+-transporting ATPase KdpF subunit